MHVGPENKSGVDVTAVKQWTSRGAGGQRALLHEKKEKKNHRVRERKRKEKVGTQLCVRYVAFFFLS